MPWIDCSVDGCDSGEYVALAPSYRVLCYVHWLKNLRTVDPEEWRLLYEQSFDDQYGVSGDTFASDSIAR